MNYPEMTVKTEVLKTLVTKASKGASNNKIVPITSLMEVRLENGTLKLTTTDGNRYLEVYKEGINGPNFSVVVPVETFSKLVQKTTTDNIKLTLKESELQFVGNGTYKIELTTDDEGVVKYTTYSFNKTEQKECSINKVAVELAIKVAKTALSNLNDVTDFYYVGPDCIASTNDDIITIVKVPFLSRGALFSRELMDLLAIMEADKINAWNDGDKWLFEVDGVTVFGREELADLPNYPIDELKELALKETDENEEPIFKSSCTVARVGVLEVLDRLSLFVSEFDRRKVNLVFNKDGVNLQTNSKNGNELVQYQGTKGTLDYMCTLDIERFLTQVKVVDEPTLKMYYAGEDMIKFVSDKVVQIVATLNDDEAADEEASSLVEEALNGPE